MDKAYIVNDAIWALVEQLGVRDSFEAADDYLDEAVNEAVHQVMGLLRISE